MSCATPVETTWGGNSGCASAGVEPERAEHPIGIDLGPEDRRLLEHRGARDAAHPQLDVDRLQAGPRLLHVVRLALGARVRVGDRRAQRGMAAKGSSPTIVQMRLR